eukprot:PLAT3874.2.p1 GENE.PLAT3874.2~~PLAT3874.2.p1  ORF type:complete len:967 (+),score=427.38 PLAT3874.2:68-2968(+)
MAILATLLRLPKDHPRLVRAATICMTIVECLALILYSVSTLPESRDISSTIWLVLDAVFAAFFTLDVAVRLALEQSLRRFLQSPVNIGYLISLVPFYASIALGGRVSEFGFYVNLLQTVRAVRVLNLGRHFASTQVLLVAARKSASVLTVPAFILSLFSVLAGATLFLLEKGTTDEATGLRVVTNNHGETVEATFTDIMNAGYFVVVTLTTVGFGDQVPNTTPGRMVTMVVVVFGMIFLAMPLTIVGNNFYDAWEAMHPSPASSVWSRKDDLQRSLYQMGVTIASARDQLVRVRLSAEEAVAAQKAAAEAAEKRKRQRMKKAAASSRSVALMAVEHATLSDDERDADMDAAVVPLLPSARLPKLPKLPASTGKPAAASEAAAAVVRSSSASRSWMKLAKKRAELLHLAPAAPVTPAISTASMLVVARTLKLLLKDFELFTSVTNSFQRTKDESAYAARKKTRRRSSRHGIALPGVDLAARVMTNVKKLKEIAESERHQAELAAMPRMQRLRRRLADLLQDRSSTAGRLLFGTFVTSSLLSVVFFCLQTSNSRSSAALYQYSEAVFLSLFTAEFLLRLLASDCSKQFWLLSSTYVDLLSTLPVLLELALSGSFSMDFTGPFSVLQFLHVFRCVRTIRLVRYFNLQSTILASALMRSYHALQMPFFFLAVFSFIFASVLYALERGTWDSAKQAWIAVDGNRSEFTDLIRAMWFVLVTMSSVGYGNVVPLTMMGRAVTVIVMLFGVLYLAMPLTIVGSNFWIAWRREVFDDDGLGRAIMLSASEARVIDQFVRVTRALRVKFHKSALHALLRRQAGGSLKHRTPPAASPSATPSAKKKAIAPHAPALARVEAEGSIELIRMGSDAAIAIPRALFHAVSYSPRDDMGGEADCEDEPSSPMSRHSATVAPSPAAAGRYAATDASSEDSSESVPTEVQLEEAEELFRLLTIMADKYMYVNGVVHRLLFDRKQ